MLSNRIQTPKRKKKSNENKLLKSVNVIPAVIRVSCQIAAPGDKI